MELRNYLEAAKKLQGFATDADLARALGMNKSIMVHYRTGRSFPDDDTMLNIARLARLDDKTALLDLNVWRAKGKAKQVYQAMAKGLTAASLAFAFWVAPASEHGVNAAQPQASVNYTLCDKRHRRWKDRVRDTILLLKHLFTRRAARLRCVPA